jgi:hypothetical protein
MEKRTRSPYPRSTAPSSPSSARPRRLHGRLRLTQRPRARLALVPGQFREMVAEKFGDREGGGPSPPGCSRSGSRPRPGRPLHHLPPGHELEGLRGRRAPLEDPPAEPLLRAHPVETTAARPATAARAGPWRARPRPRPLLGGADARPAHGRGLLDPGSDKGALMQMNCNVCHRYDRETKGADLINLAKGSSRRRAAAPATSINGRGGTIGPDLTYVGDKAAEQYDYGRLGGQKTAFAWHVAHFKDPRALVQDTVMPNFGSRHEGRAGPRHAHPLVAQGPRPRRVPPGRPAHRPADRRRSARRSGCWTGRAPGS